MSQIPTLRQFEALRYVYFMQMTHGETAVRMGITRQGVEKLLTRLCVISPIFKDMLNPEKATPPKIVTYFESMGYGVDSDF